MAFGSNMLQFAIVLSAIDHASGVLKSVETQVESLNKSFAGTEHYRQAAQNMAMAGAASAAMGATIALPLKDMVESAAATEYALHHLGTAILDPIEKVRDLAQAQDFAEKMSVRFNASQEDVIQNLFLGVSYGLSFKQAIDNATVSLAVAKGGMGDAAETGKALAIIFNDFGDTTRDATPQIQHFGDVVAFATRHFAFANVGQFTEGINIAIGSAKAVGVPFEDMVSVLSAFNKVGIQGSEAGTALMEALQALGRGGFEQAGVAVARFNIGASDVIGTILNLKKSVAGHVIDEQTFARLSKSLGIRGTHIVGLDLASLEDIRAQIHGATAGAAMAGANEMLDTTEEKLGSLGKAWHNFRESFGDQLLGPLNQVGNVLGRMVHGITGFASAHPQIVKFVAIFAAISSALLIAGGAVLALIGGILFLGGIVGIAAATIGWIVGIGAAIVALVAVPWTWAPSVLKFFANFGTWAFKAGVSIVTGLAKGIWSNITAPIDAIKWIARKIGGLIIGHSPPPEGPLYQLNRMRLIETIAETIRPAPVLNAMRRTAMAAMIAAPMVVAAPAIAAARIAQIAMPVTAQVPAVQAAARGAGGVAAETAPITINYSVTINGTNLDRPALMAELRKSAYDLKRIVDGETTRQNRKAY